MNTATPAGRPRGGSITVYPEILKNSNSLRVGVS